MKKDFERAKKEIRHLKREIRKLQQEQSALETEYSSKIRELEQAKNEAIDEIATAKAEVYSII